MTRRIFQLGTNNWQRDGEFAPGSGILHESHHLAYDSLPGWQSYSMYPSRVQRRREAQVEVFALDHDIPICESISPTSSYRWHSMSDEEFEAYRARLGRQVLEFMDRVESEGPEFDLAIAHHSFLNPLVLRDVLQERARRGKRRMALVCFVHGTALKMYAHEKSGARPDEFPARFLPYMKREGVFDHATQGREHGGFGVDLCAAISSAQVEALRDIFPEFPEDRVIVSPNGYDQGVFQRVAFPDGGRDAVLSRFHTVPAPESDFPEVPVATEGGFDGVVIFCGKFADWKRLECLLHAARDYERDACIATLVVGSGPPEDQRRMQELAFRKLGLRHAYFLGPRSQRDLATLYSAADVGCFPSYREPFGLVFIECMACGTPVIGADSGGPRDFVDGEVGLLVPETEDPEALARSLTEAVKRALQEDWKSTKGPVAQERALSRFSVRTQCENLLSAIDAKMGRTEPS